MMQHAATSGGACRAPLRLDIAQMSSISRHARGSAHSERNSPEKHAQARSRGPADWSRQANRLAFGYVRREPHEARAHTMAPAEQPLLEAGTPSCAQHGATLSAVSFVGADDGAPRRPSRARAARWAGCAAPATLAATALLGGARRRRARRARGAPRRAARRRGRGRRDRRPPARAADDGEPDQRAPTYAPVDGTFSPSRANVKKVEWECGGEHMALACKIKAEFKNLVSEREPRARARRRGCGQLPAALPALVAARAVGRARRGRRREQHRHDRPAAPPPRASYVYTLWLTESGDISAPHGDGDVVPTMTNGTGFPNSTADTLGGAYTTACANATAVHNGALARARRRAVARSRARASRARRAPRARRACGVQRARAKPSRL